MPRFESTILNDYFSSTNSHTHDGVNSTKIKYSDLTGTPGYASKTEAGLIKVGNNLSIDSNGILSASTGASNYKDLTNKPILNTNNTTALTVNAAEEIVNTISLHKISKTGNYNDLNNLPTIPTKTSELTNDSGYITQSSIINNLTSTSTTSALSANQGRILNNKKLEPSNIKAGSNITLDVSGNNITINSIGGSGSEEVEIGNTEPTEDSIELWVDTSEQGTGSIGIEQIEYGNITAAQMTNASIGGQDGKIYELTFQNSYSTPPTVITNFYSEQGISYYGFVATQVVALSNTKCILCVFVQGLTGSKCGISYMVKGK